jgi:hypothetical protein
MGIGVETRSKRVAYAAMTRVVGSPDRPAVISVVSTDKQLDSFREQFVAESVEEFVEGAALSPTRPVAASATPAPAPRPAALSRIDDAPLVWAAPNRPLSAPRQPGILLTSGRIDMQPPAPVRPTPPAAKCLPPLTATPPTATPSTATPPPPLRPPAPTPPPDSAPRAPQAD